MPLPPREPGSPGGDDGPKPRKLQKRAPGEGGKDASSGKSGGLKGGNTGGLKAGGTGGLKRKRRRPPGMPIPVKLPAATGPGWRAAAGVVLVLAGMVGAGAAYVFSQAAQEEQVVSNPNVVARPSVEPKTEGVAPKRPGLALHPPDEVYLPKALDVVGTDLEGPVTALMERGVLTAFADGTFRPKEACPRAEFLVWAYNAIMAQSVKGDDPFIPVKLALPTATVTGTEFSDLPADHWAAPALASIKASGILNKVLTPAILPDGPLSREQLLAWAARLCVTQVDQAVLDKEPDPTKLAAGLRRLNYTDPEAVGEAFQTSVAFMLGEDKRRRWVGGTFPPPLNPSPLKPQSTVTRGEAAAFLGEAYAALGLGLQ